MVLRGLRAEWGQAMAVTTPEITLSPEDQLAHEYTIQYLAKVKRLFVVLAAGYSIIFVLSLVVVMYMRHHRAVALRGDSNAARKIILPAYTPLLQLFLGISLVYALYFWVMLIASEFDEFPTVVEMEIYYSGHIFFLCITIVYMYQKSVTTPALKRAVLISLVLAIYNLPVVWVTDTYCSIDVAYWVPQMTRLLLGVGVVYACVSPPARASRRTLREYCGFVLVYFSGEFIFRHVIHEGFLDEGFILAFVCIIWGSLCPLVIWRVLRADTEHWRGLGRRALTLQTLFRQKNCIDERISSRGLHVLIEMHRKHIIDFAYLDIKGKIGVGSSAVAFNGVLHSKTAVAIKVYTPTELTDEVVAEFSHETALCGALHHPNIVHFHGMCVCPPTICLVFELCQGSLDDMTQALARRPQHALRRQLMIDLNYMIDATRAVAYLHSFTPAFVHRDIKPANFLVDDRSVVKLTDFGESRSLPHARGAPGASPEDSSCNDNDPSTDEVGTGSSAASARLSHDTWSSMVGPSRFTARSAMTVRGTAEYMAPEMIQGKAGQALYGEAADIFSLTMTLWDILYPLKDKYPRANGNHLKVFEAVLGDERPHVETDCHPGLRELLFSGWATRPDHRPSALSMLNTLERIQQEVSSDAAMDISRAMEHQIVISKNGCTTEGTYSGRTLIQKMLEFDFVGCVGEGIRAGNGFMSSGLLHHGRHIHGFDNTDELFQFDDARLHVLQQSDERLHLPPIVDRSAMIDELDTNRSENKLFAEPVVLTTSNSSTTVPAGQAGNQSAKLLYIPSIRKLSNPATGSGRHEDHRKSSSSSSQPAASVLPAPICMNPNSCLCRKLGAGMMYISKGQHRRFRRGIKGVADGEMVATMGDTAPGGGLLGIVRHPGVGMVLGNGDANHTRRDTSGLTAKLLMNEFSHTGDSVYSDDDPLQSPTSSLIELAMAIRGDDTSDEDEHDHITMR